MEAFLGTLWMSFTDFFLFRHKKESSGNNCIDFKPLCSYNHNK